MARAEVRGTFSQLGPRRPASAGRLARTLGIRTTAVQYSSRMCACRRELNTTMRQSREYPGDAASRIKAAESPAVANNQRSVEASVSTSQPKCTRTLHETARRQGSTHLPGTRQIREGVFQGQALGLSATCKATWARLWPALQGAERHAKSLAGAADAEYRDCSCGGAEREAEWPACKSNPVRLAH